MPLNDASVKDGPWAASAGRSREITGELKDSYHLAMAQPSYGQGTTRYLGACAGAGTVLPVAQ